VHKIQRSIRKGNQMGIEDPTTVEFITDKRIAYGRFEWALGVRLDGASRWVVAKWEKEPSEEQIEQVKTIVKRSFELYHRHLIIPPFNLVEVKR
jgi:hypothetical protein